MAELGAGKTKKRDFAFSKYYPPLFTGLLLFILFQYSFVGLETIFYDLRIRFDWVGSSRGEKEIVTVIINEESDGYLGESYPYSYGTHKHFLENLIADGPSIINYLATLPPLQAKRERPWAKKFQEEIQHYRDKGGAFKLGEEAPWGDEASFAKDGVVRRAILNRAGEDSLSLWTAKTYRQSRGLNPMKASDFQGSYYSPEADTTLALFRYLINPERGREEIKSIPYHWVRVGNFPQGFFKDKIVLVGPAYISHPDHFVSTPFHRGESKASRIDVQAAITLALIHGKTVYPLSKSITHVFILLITLFLSWGISRMKPGHSFFMAIILVLGLSTSAHLLFSFYGLWLTITPLILTVLAVCYIWTPFRAMEEYQRRFALQEEKKWLKKVEGLKQNFISLMSHDLKTPVAKIAGLADLMLQRKQFHNAEGEKNLRLIVDSTWELNQFISSILDLTKIESRNFTLNKVSRDINKAVEQAVTNLRYQATQKKIEISTTLAPLYPIQYDTKLMDRVLSNLLENALKYCGEGAKIEVETWDEGSWVYVEMRDNGIGIEESDLQHIFDKFYRVKEGALHSVQGSGLGLFLVKYFIELHGGKITVTSQRGKGSQFKIALKNK